MVEGAVAAAIAAEVADVVLQPALIPSPKQVCGAFKSAYFDFKAVSAAECPANPWEMQNAALFARLDGLGRCDQVAVAERKGWSRAKLQEQPNLVKDLGRDFTAGCQGAVWDSINPDTAGRTPPPGRRPGYPSTALEAITAFPTPGTRAHCPALWV